MAKVDIVMPLYNKASVVQRAVDSILKQSLEDWRIIVVDDGSTDGSGDVVLRIDDCRIEIVRQENAGPGAARNKGIELSTAEYIAFLDADDEWMENYLKASIKSLQENDVNITSCMYYEWPGKIDVAARYKRLGVVPGRYEMLAGDNPKTSDRRIFFLHVWNTVMKTEVARKYGGFYAEDKCKFAEDTVFFMRILANEAFLITEKPLACHHREDSSLANLEKDPIAPFLVDSNIVLRYCPDEKRQLMKNVINHVALRTARKYARRGFKAEAIELVERFPEIKKIEGYRQCAFEISTSNLFKHWVGFKCTVGPAVRSLLRKAGRKVGVIKQVPDFDSRDYND